MAWKLNSRGFSVTEIMVLVVVVLLLGAAGSLVYLRQQDKKTAIPNQASTSQKSVDSADPSDVTVNTAKNSNDLAAFDKQADAINVDVDDLDKELDQSLSSF